MSSFRQCPSFDIQLIEAKNGRQVDNIRKVDFLGQPSHYIVIPQEKCIYVYLVHGFEKVPTYISHYGGE